MFHRIVHANDGSGNAFKALDTAAALARLCGARLDVVFVEELSPRSGTIEDVTERKRLEDRHLRERKDRMAEIVGRHGIAVHAHSFRGHAVQRIVEFVRGAEADLLVIGATEHANLIELVFGRRSDRIAHLASCSVLIAR
jgi:nucleotide-binding universal stress UspA family protein